MGPAVPAVHVKILMVCSKSLLPTNDLIRIMKI